MTFRDISVVSSRSRSLVNTVATHTGLSMPSPTNQRVVVHLLPQLPLGPDRVEQLQQACPDQPLRRDRGAAMGGVETCELTIPPRQRVVHHPPDRAQRMTRRNALLQGRHN